MDQETWIAVACAAVATVGFPVIAWWQGRYRRRHGLVVEDVDDPTVHPVR